jgi:HEPN domain-containing protein
MGDEHALARQLLDRADDDVAAADALLHADRVSDAIVGFHAQQAVEKALKAVLAAHHVEYPFTHDLQLLVALCEQGGAPMPADLADDVPRLSPYATRLRYGGCRVGPHDDRLPARLNRVRIQAQSGGAPLDTATRNARLIRSTSSGRTLACTRRRRGGFGAR